jgi:hypothetical protein
METATEISRKRVCSDAKNPESEKRISFDSKKLEDDQSTMLNKELYNNEQSDDIHVFRRTDVPWESSSVDADDVNRPTSPIFKGVSNGTKHLLANTKSNLTCPLTYPTEVDEEQIDESSFSMNTQHAEEHSQVNTDGEASSQELFSSLSPSAKCNSSTIDLFIAPTPLKTGCLSKQLFDCFDVGDGLVILTGLESPKSSQDAESSNFVRSVPAPWPVIESMLNAL